MKDVIRQLLLFTCFCVYTVCMFLFLYCLDLVETKIEIKSRPNCIDIYDNYYICLITCEHCF